MNVSGRRQISLQFTMQLPVWGPLGFAGCWDNLFKRTECVPYCHCSISYKLTTRVRPFLLLYEGEQCFRVPALCILLGNETQKLTVSPHKTVEFSRKLIPHGTVKGGRTGGRVDSLDV